MDIAIIALQELCSKTAGLLREFEVHGRDVMINKTSFRQFSQYITQIKILLQELKGRQVDVRTDSAATKASLEKLTSQLRSTCRIIEKNISGSKLSLLLNSKAMLLEMEKLAKEIAETISLLDLSNVDVNLGLKSKIDQVVNEMSSMEFKTAAKTEAILLEIEKTMTSNGNSRDHTIQLLHKIAEAVGVNTTVLLAKNELEQLKREKEEMDMQQRQAEALQLSQLIMLLNSSDISKEPKDERPASNRQNPVSAFKCPLNGEVMEEPVAIICGHSFEKSTIEEYFTRGETTCPTCKIELHSLVLTPNLSLRNSIREWEEREMQNKFHATLSNLSSDEPAILNQAVEDLQNLLEMPHCRAACTEKEIVSKLVKFLKNKRINSKAALKCLCCLAQHSECNQETIADAGAVHSIVKQFYRGEADPDVIDLILIISEKEALAEKVGSTKRCIPFLVSMLQSSHSGVSSKAYKVLQNLSSNIHSVIKMAEAGHFPPFLTQFNQGHLETQALMAAALLKMQLQDTSVKVLEQKQFISTLVRLLSLSSPANKTSSLECIKKLSAYPTVAKLFLAETGTIPALLGIVSFIKSEPYSRQVALEILTSLVSSTQLSDLENNSNFQELQSQHNIGVIMLLAIESPNQIKVQFFRLLLAICQISETARRIVRSDHDANAHLFSCLEVNHINLRQQALKLIYAISENQADLSLPSSPAKEAAIRSLVMILTSSEVIEEISAAARIISQLPSNDTIVDMILQQSEALQAFHKVICTMDDENYKKFATPNMGLLENVLAALLRFTDPTKPELRRQLNELQMYPSLVRVLSQGSSLAKKRTAMALARLSQSTTPGTTKAIKMKPTSLFPSMSRCCFPQKANDHNYCSVHGSTCSSRQTFCLVKADAVRPLIELLRETENDAAEAAIVALDTLLEDSAVRSGAAKAIVQKEGVEAILDILEKGPLSSKEKALDLFQKVFEHTRSQIANQQCQRARGVLIHLLQNESLRKKVAPVLSQMELIPKQSSYF